MKWFVSILPLVVLPVTPAFAGVTVNTPSNGDTVNSPVQYSASGSTNTCSKGVASMGVYVDSKLVQVQNGKAFNGNIEMSAGSHHTVVEEWDYCGGASYTPIDVKVASQNQNGVFVSAPSNGSNVGSPVSYSATSTSSCSKGVASMGVYVDSKLNYVVNGAKLNTNITIGPGNHDTVVQMWDHCGGSAFKHVQVSVSGGGKVFSGLQGTGGWKGYGEYPPNYDICKSCGGGVTWSMGQGVGSPSMTGNATKFSIGGSHPYSDVLWTNSLIGDFSSQGIKDEDRKIIPNLHYFTYDLYFYSSQLGVAQVMEFDINQYFNGNGFVYGHQCRIAGGHEWDVWDNVNKKWKPTGIPCNPVQNAWNHVTIQVQRTSDNKLRYHSISLNGNTKILDWYYPHYNSGNWYGMGVNFQLDGNYQQSPYTVYVDKFSLTYE